MSNVCRLKSEDIRLCWDKIKSSVDDIRVTFGMDWRCEDVYARCLNGSAYAYTCDDGFLILQPRENQFNLDKELYVWICFSWGDDVLEKYQDDIKLLAKEIGAKRIIFESNRNGFHRVAKANGWIEKTAYIIKVNE